MLHIWQSLCCSSTVDNRQAFKSGDLERSWKAHELHKSPVFMNKNGGKSLLQNEKPLSHMVRVYLWGKVK